MRLAVLAIAASLFVACKPPPMPAPVKVLVRVLDEAKAPVDGAEVAAASQIIGKTGRDGRTELVVSGREGATYPIEVRCPAGYRSPDAPLMVRRLDNGTAALPEYVARCSRLRHRLVVRIQVKGADRSLSVLRLGKALTRTDAEGKAVVVLEGDVLERVDLQLDTSDPALSKLHPQSPISSFEIPNHDDETTLDVKFTRDAKRVVRVGARRPPAAL
jgi:hypothetical protein